MASLTPNSLEQLRARLLQRAESSIPVWPVAVRSCADRNALAVLLGTMLGKLPHDDIAPLVRPILLEQDENGSWGNDLSRTLEIVQALSQAQRPEARPHLNKAVTWLEEHPNRRQLRAETLLLLGHTTGLGAPIRFKQILKPALHVAIDWSFRNRNTSRKLAAHLLLGEKGSDNAKMSALIRRQLSDGSWEGNARTTALAMAALRQAGLPASDSLFDRGFRFMRVLQQWDGNDLIQAPCDVSNALHALTLRSVLLAGAENNDAAPSAMLLLHQQDQSGGWAIGSGQPVDVLTTAMALDALAMFGDSPLETRWARRRAAEFLIAAQNRDGSFSMLPRSNGFALRGRANGASLEATCYALLGLCECGESNAAQAMSRAAGYIRRHQLKSGAFAESSLKSALYSTVLAAEALDLFGGTRADVERALDWVQGTQHVLGGFGDDLGLTSWHTAVAIRGLSLRPARYAEALSMARTHLTMRQDDETKWWNDPAANLFVPALGMRMSVTELTTLAALESLHTGSRTRAQRSRKPRTTPTPER
ncbi:MAG: terpene cyclase/mutase family protein [bacterium]|nr:terpene cyclase/mutase family protein [bacterium]